MFRGMVGTSCQDEVAQPRSTHAARSNGNGGLAAYNEAALKSWNDEASLARLHAAYAPLVLIRFFS